MVAKHPARAVRDAKHLIVNRLNLSEHPGDSPAQEHYLAMGRIGGIDAWRLPRVAPEQFLDAGCRFG